MNGKTVIVTEDEGEIRELLSLLFESDGFTVLKASDGQEALQLLREHTNEIVLLVTDLGLPKLGGMELIAEARSLIPSLRVIAASGFGHPDLRPKLRELGVEIFFPKPFSPLELLAAAKELLNQK
jgi:two-component system, cell cycle sensor histidine kinase and response regulator CckA